MNRCLNCETEITNLKFCNRSCSATYNNKKRKPRTKESRKKIGDKLVLYYKQLSKEEKATFAKKGWKTKRDNGFTIKTEKVLDCTYCKIPFKSFKKSTGGYTTTCSDECFKNIKKHNAKGIKRQEYNGQIFDSGYEVRVAKFLDENKIKWIIPDKAIYWYDKTGKQRKYFPDFYLPEYNVYLDPKNPFCIEQQKEKLKEVNKLIKLIFGSPEYIFETINAFVG